MARVGELLILIPPAPGSSQCVVQNPLKGTEYDVDPEAWTCNCPAFENRHKCKHLPFAADRLASERTEATPGLIQTLRAQAKAEHGQLPPAEELAVVQVLYWRRVAAARKAA